ncbi:AAA family ATPase [Brevibacterium aurantiacum]|uniref:AAA family ATPase n=1 Tax=Brevibacterium aurantiacum TaxID=273384 RepID=UPI0000510305|nr:AAA family ATPase [Brevibacterium aurantiacum]
MNEDESVFEYTPQELSEGRQPAPRPGRVGKITWAVDIDPEPVVWAWTDGDNGRIPSGSLSIAAGREGTGKSSFGIWMAAQISRGVLPGAYYGTPKRILYVAFEDSWKYTLVPRLIAAGADLGSIGRLDIVSTTDEMLTLSLPDDNIILEQQIIDNDVALVVVDPLMSVMGQKIDTHRNREVRTALDPLARIADTTGSIFLGIAHFNKGAGTDAASLISGSGAFKDVPRSVFGFAKDEDSDDGTRVMTQVKNSLGMDSLPSLEYRIETAIVPTKKGDASTGLLTFAGESDKSVGDILSASRSGGDAEDRNDAEQFIVDFLDANSPPEAKAGDVLRAGRAAGFNDQTLKDARRRAKNPRIPSQKSDFNNGWVWRLEHEGGAQGGERGKESTPAILATFVPPSDEAEPPLIDVPPAPTETEPTLEWGVDPNEQDQAS